MNEIHLARSQELMDHEQPADVAVDTWRDVWNALSPIIGAAGAAALYQRSLSLRISEYPWLSSVIDSLESGEFNSLRQELSQQTRAEAAAANAALLHSLSQILVNLIGASLTARLLQPVFEKHGHANQDGAAQ
jgi:hypothetical protein